MPADLDTLRPIVDQPDFEQALREDPDGSFKASVESYLAEWKAILAGELGKGQTPEDFEALNLFAEALETSSKVVEFQVLARSLKENAPGNGQP